MANSENAPDELPRLSSSATRINVEKLESLPWDHSGKHPGNRPFWEVIRRAVDIAWSYIIRHSEMDSPPEVEGGSVYASTHINGLIDPLAIMKSQDRRIIAIGRHDIMTMPVIGWITRRIGSQPVIRRAELERGVSDPEFAKRINKRSMLTMANCISSGHAAIVMPEGKSHQDTKMHALRTGALRFTLNASSIAHERGLPQPVIQPVGLHFRCHYWFRTDVFVEFGEPITIPLLDDPKHHTSLAGGEWLEPPAEQVIPLRDELYESLIHITPNAPDWETYRAWHLLGHLRANSSTSPLNSLKQEVLAARDIREQLTLIEGTSSLVEDAKEAADILHSVGLDARTLDVRGRIKSESRLVRGALGVLAMLLFAPITIPTTGLQALVGWYAGDHTDEGIDARTTHHMIAAIFSPLFLWPLISLAFLYSLFGATVLLPIYLAVSLPIIHMSNLVFLWGYDMLTDFGDSRRRRRLASSVTGGRLEELVGRLVPRLGVLK
jgi:1-acyl-sn-glycerol-3-phosphate acyltransferase